MHHEDIKAALRKRGVTGLDLAKHLDVTPTTVSAVIRGTTKSARVAKAISKITGFSVNQMWPEQYGSHRPKASVGDLLRKAA